MRETWERRGMLGSPNEMLCLEEGQQGGAAGCICTRPGGPHCGCGGMQLALGGFLGALILLFPPGLVQEHVCCFHRAELTRAQ